MKPRVFSSPEERMTVPRPLEACQRLVGNQKGQNTRSKGRWPTGSCVDCTKQSSRGKRMPVRVCVWSVLSISGVYLETTVRAYPFPREVPSSSDTPPLFESTLWEWKSLYTAGLYRCSARRRLSAKVMERRGKSERAAGREKSSSEEADVGCQGKLAQCMYVWVCISVYTCLHVCV